MGLEILWASAMVLLACAFLTGAVLIMFRKLAKKYPPVSYSIYHRTEPLLDETDRFIEEMDKKLEQPDVWRHVK